MSLADLIANRSSSAPLEKASCSSLPVAAGESPSDAKTLGEPESTLASVEGVPAETSQEAFSSGDAQQLAEDLDRHPDADGRRPILRGEEPGRESDAEVESASSSPINVPSPEPRGVNKSETPSGIQIYFQAAPKRLYQLQKGRSKWVEVPSVSEILDILEKGGLSWWGMKVGVAGVQDLFAKPWDELRNAGLSVNWTEDGPEILIELLKKYKLTVNDTLADAGDRGDSVHNALELWATKGILPQVEIYRPAEQGYVSGLRDFLVDAAPEAIASEVMVGSLKHKFAGRYDLSASIPKKAEVVVKTFPKAKPIRVRVPGGLHRLDLKTSKDVYDTHFLQLEAYEEAAVEDGFEPSDYRAVIHVTADGRYELAYNIARGPDSGKAPDFEKGILRATFANFRAIKNAYKALAEIKGRK